MESISPTNIGSFIGVIHHKVQTCFTIYKQVPDD